VKLVAQADALAAAVKVAASAIDAKAAKRSPILAALLIDASDYDLRFVGTDLDLAIAAKCTGDGITQKPGRCAVAGEALSKLFAGIAPETEVTIETVGSGLQIKAGRARYQLPALPAEDFPQPPATTSTVEMVLSRDEVQHLFGAVAFAANVEDARFYLQGVYLHRGSRSSLCGVATDGHRLALANSAIMPALGALPTNGKGTGIIIPNKVITLINKLKAAELELRADDRVIEIRVGNLLISSKLIAGTFPDYSKIIPPEPGNTAKLERKALLAALWRLRAVHDVTEQAINMTLGWQDGDNAIRLTLADGDLGEDVVAASTVGAAQIILSVSQMVTMAEEISAEWLQLGVSDKHSPIRIAAGENFLAVLAPCTK
jgi:DNA polymerase III subunit beta